MKPFKRLFFQILLFSVLIFMVCFPQKAFQGASAGLLLWFQTMLPTLLPFIIISNLLISFELTAPLTAAASPILSRIFGTSPNGSYPVVVGFLCGYPMGAKVTADLLRQKKISTTEANYILSFCNNASPGYMLGFICIGCLGMKQPTLWFILLVYTPIIIYAILINMIHKCRKQTKQVDIISLRKPSIDKPSISKKQPFLFSMDKVDAAIIDGFTVMVKLGGYMILFSILGEMITLLPNLSNTVLSIVMLLNEITTGSKQAATLITSQPIRTALILSATSFGGLSCLAQTNSMIKNTGLSLLSYIRARLCIAVITFCMTLFYFASSGIH